ncbi:MAG: LytTR family transcriptional regulator DNA-binding domain-containing protein [Anaerolineales bacterium]|nr:LytTR family transcriptional regulator DNA-binding domain-containing protein [Anaerolineales bacterium]
MIAIELNQVQKTIGNSNALEIKSLIVESGELAAVIGQAGSGKTILLKILTGNTIPTSGTVRLLGLDPVKAKKQLNHKIGVLFSENGLYERLSALENLGFHCRLRHLPKTRAMAVLEQVGLADRASEPASRLPPSLARRLAFGRTILHQPAILLLEKPFSGCDDSSVEHLSRLMRQFAKEGTAILVLSPETGDLDSLCQTIHFLEKGQLVKSYSPQASDLIEIPFKIPARQEDQVVLVNPADILYISTENEQTCLNTVFESIASHLTIGELDQRLSHNGFFRAHRSYLVNLQRVKAVVPYTRDSFTLILDDAQCTEIPLSKSSARKLRDLLGY